VHPSSGWSRIYWLLWWRQILLKFHNIPTRLQCITPHMTVINRGTEKRT
jgi:hypothetical protein